MLNQSIRTLIPVMAVPTIVAQLITTVYNLVDTYFVSTLGTYATAAVGVNSSLERAITMTGSLIGAGACSYIARLLGGKRKEDADRVLSTFLFIGLGLGCALLVLGQCFSTPLVNLLGATDDCRELSVQYAFYVLFAAPFMVGQLVLNMCLRSEGSAVYSMVGIGFGGVLNCFLDPLFIYVFDMGVGGASLATAISKFVSFVILLIPYLRKSTTVDLSIRHCKWNANDTREVLSIGSASFFRSGLGVVASILLNNVAGSISTAALAAFSVANRVMQ
ncbi:MAG: MATE family efflux transporter, partial [Clostridiales bacterium]|nr:MATE family efflux transporter [Clostridiales bacterium]